MGRVPRFDLDGQEHDGGAFAGGGGYDPPLTVITLGVLLPAALLIGVACMSVWRAMPTPRGWLTGWAIVGTFVSLGTGMALALVSHYLLPNIRRDCYGYQWPAAVALALGVIGGVLLLLAAAGIGSRNL